ncbi:MAG TPA: dihydrolipoamide acetyltransferase family protein [Jatrophihabitantaceae bacterium]|jgi:pyruvate dehydrogenase E2 component (dihydrolipoamide acetyltransferase)
MPDADFALPDLGEGLTEATIVEWLVGVGDPVRVDQPVVEVETAKARVEVPAPFAGVIAALHAEPGETVPVGFALLTVTQQQGAFAEPGVASAAADESGRVLVGYGTSTPARRERRSGTTATARAISTSAAATGGNRPVISPLVRRLARENHVDVARLSGSGPDGTVLRRDVEAALSAKRVPMTAAHKSAAELYTRSRREIPEATVWVDVDATGLLEARVALNAARPNEPVSLLALLARFAVLGLRRFPELNARIEHDALVLFDDVHLGFAAQTDRGLIVPVVKNAHTMSTRELAGAIGAQAADARSGAIAPVTLRGGTFTVNNYGVFGVDGSAAIINHPEVAILGMGRIIDRPWAVSGQLAVRKITQLTLAFDHRACDGAVAGGFLRFVADCVESPVTALGDL